MCDREKSFFLMSWLSFELTCTKIEWVIRRRDVRFKLPFLRSSTHSWISPSSLTNFNSCCHLKICKVQFWQVKIVKPGLSFRLWGCQPSLDMSPTFANAFSQWPVFFCTLPWEIVSPGSSSQSAPEEPRPLSASQPPASRLPPVPPLLSPPKDIKLSFNFLELWQFQL